MHPDAIIAGLRRELDRLDRSAPDHKDRKAAILDEIKATDALERPAATAETPTLVADPNASYLAGLKREINRIDRSDKKRVAEIKAEMKRVESLIRTVPTPEPVAESEDSTPADPPADPPTSDPPADAPDPAPNVSTVVDVAADGTATVELPDLEPEMITGLAAGNGTAVKQDRPGGGTLIVLSGATAGTRVEITYHTPPE